MTELIAFRAVQGLGAGGLMSLSMAITGDIVSPRERGKYQASSEPSSASRASPARARRAVRRPSLWRWSFYVNVPLGVVALIVLSTTLPNTQGRERPVIDYLGAASWRRT